jgi:hypothetical protein
LDLQPDYNIGIKSSGGDNLTRNPNRGGIIQKITESVKKRYGLMTDEEKGWRIRSLWTKIKNYILLKSVIKAV